MQIESHIGGPFLEGVVGSVFDDEISNTELVRVSTQGLNNREVWRCEGYQGSYYVKFYETDDTSWMPEAAFFELYAEELTCAVSGRAVTDLDADSFGIAIVTKEAQGTSLDILLQRSDQAETRRLSRAAALNLKELHTIEIGGFGPLTFDGTEYKTWSDYIDAMAAERQEHTSVLLAGGLTGSTISQVVDVLFRSKDEIVEPVLCHGDAKTEHAVANNSGATLIDFGRTQGNLPIRDCLQYTRQSAVFDEETLAEALMEKTEIPVACLRAVSLIRATNLLAYAVKTENVLQRSAMQFLIDDTLSVDDRVFLSRSYD